MARREGWGAVSSDGEINEHSFSDFKDQFSVIIIVSYGVQVIDAKRDSKPGKSESWGKERKRCPSKEEKNDEGPA